MNLIDNATNIQNYVNIGFCQRSFYTPTVWSRAERCMSRLIELGYVILFKYKCI